MKKTGIVTTIRESSEEELKGRLVRLEEELFQHRLKRHTNQLENTNVIRETRREIAIVNTVLSARKRGEKQLPKSAPVEAQE